MVVLLESMPVEVVLLVFFPEAREVGAKFQLALHKGDSQKIHLRCDPLVVFE